MVHKTLEILISQLLPLSTETPTALEEKKVTSPVATDLSLERIKLLKQPRQANSFTILQTKDTVFLRK